MPWDRLPRLARDLGREFCALEFERLELRIDRLVELFGNLAARRRERGGSSAIALRSLAGGGVEARQRLRAGIDAAEIGGIAGGKRIELVDRHIVLARGGAQGEQPLLDFFKLAWVVVGLPQRLLEVCARIFQRRERGIERARRRLDQRGRLGGAAFEPAQRRRQSRHRRGAPRHRVVRIAQIARDLLRRHHGGAARGERGLLGGPGLEGAKLRDRVAQPVGLALRALDLGAGRRARHRFAPVVQAAPSLAPPVRDRRMHRVVAVRRGIHQRTLVVLAWIRPASRRGLQDLRAHRLVVDEARVRPSANCTRRRISSSATAIPSPEGARDARP